MTITDRAKPAANRKMYAAVLAIACGLHGALLSAQQPASQVNTAVIPVGALEKDSYDWNQRHQDVLLAKKMNPQVVLIGDSITHFWGGVPKASHENGAEAYKEVFGKRRVLNLGFGWDRTQNVLWRLDHDELRELYPKAVVINIGTNNLTGTSHARANTPEEIALGVMAVVDEVHEQTPQSRIVVMGIFPRGGSPTDPRRAAIAKVNQILSADLSNRSNVLFLDIGSSFLDPDGTLPREMMSDGTHPTEKGYEVWAKALKSAGV
jgi:lysophospholipase L1-like esterase